MLGQSGIGPSSEARPDVRWYNQRMERRPILSMLRTDETMAAHAAWLARDFGRREMAPLSPADVAVLAGTFTPVRVKAGTKLFAAMRAPEAAFIVESGEVEIAMRRGARRMVLGIARTGDVVGDVPLLCDMAPPFGAVARTDATLLRLERDALQKLLATYPAISLRWLSSLVRRLEQAQRRIVALMVGDIRARTIAVIAEELLTAGKAEVRLSQGEIAALLGATRQSVNRVLGALASEGLIAQQYGSIEILEPDRLLSLAGAFDGT